MQGGVGPTCAMRIGDLLQFADTFLDNGRHGVLECRITKVDSACQRSRFTGFAPAVDLVGATCVVELLGMVHMKRSAEEKHTGFQLA